MSDLAEQESPVPPLLRDRSGVQRVTNIELFFDLVYVFAVTQLSHYLIGHSTVAGALQTGLLLAMVWLVWSYTTWVTNWLDPERMAVRLLLVVLMLVSLAMSVSLPRAFEDLGLWVGGAYALQQIGRSLFMVIALRGHPLEANFQRILAWCVVSSALALAGGLAHGNTRILLWLGSVCVDLLGGIVGFATPGLGRSRTSDWTIEGGHFAERCQAFILIALGESIVIIGATLTDVKPVTAPSVASFVVAFAGRRCGGCTSTRAAVWPGSSGGLRPGGRAVRGRRRVLEDAARAHPARPVLRRDQRGAPREPAGRRWATSGSRATVSVAWSCP